MEDLEQETGTVCGSCFCRVCPGWPRYSGLILEQNESFGAFDLQNPQKESVIFHPDMNPA